MFDVASVFLTTASHADSNANRHFKVLPSLRFNGATETATEQTKGTKSRKHFDRCSVFLMWT